MDNAAIKAKQHETWKNVAPGWKRWEGLMRRMTQPVTDRMIRDLKPGQRVLDIALGVGEPAISAAEAVGPTGSVLGTDLVGEMLATARENAAARGVTNVEFRQVDGEALDVPAGAFDVVTMRWGLMFMPDPVACLAGARAALKPGGRIVLSCWGAPPRNPWASIPLGVLAKHVEIPAPPPGAPGLFAFADGARLRATLEEAGFSDVALQEVEVDMSDFATGEEFVKYVFDLAGPIAMHYARVPEAKQPQVASEIAREAEQAGGGGARLKGVTWVATAHA